MGSVYSIWIVIAQFVLAVNGFVFAAKLGYMWFMTLDEYLRKNKITSLQFSGLMKVSVGAVTKWRQGTRLPRPIYLRRIENLSSKKVRPKDWYQ